MKKTSEYVSLGHPDKIADYISEYILDRIIEQDPKPRYALEIQTKDNHITYGGELTTTANIKDLHKWIQDAVRHIGYTHEYAAAWPAGYTLDADNLDIKGHISKQSPDIAEGVDMDGWGDQGVFFGFYCDETSHGDGIDHAMAKLLGQTLYYTAKEQPITIFGLDIKTQVTVEQVKNGVPYVSQVVVAIPIRDFTSHGRRFIKRCVIDFLKTQNARKTSDYTCIVNGTGEYKRHASMGDCGTTGRKLVVDFYGGRSRIGGGSPWTKDGSKADLTLNLYAHELAEQFYHENKDNWGEHEIWFVESELSCCIGKSNITGTLTAYDHKGKLLIAVDISGDIKPSHLIQKYKLNTPRFADMCEYGLFTE